MKFYRIEDEVVFSDKPLTIGTLLTLNSTDAAGEKHVPVVTVDGDKVVVKVGEVEHPSLPAHYIEFILLETNTGIHTKWLQPGMKPEGVFRLGDGETVVAAYEYCNLHELWKGIA